MDVNDETPVFVGGPYEQSIVEVFSTELKFE